jgi:hypothetical protein
MVDKNIINDMFNDIETNLQRDLYTEFTTNAGEIFEMITYYSYIYINNKKYNYNFINFCDTIKSYLKDEYINYIENKKQRLGGALEFMFAGVNNDNFNSCLKFIEDYKIRFCRPDYCDINLYKTAVKNSEYLNLILCSENNASLVNFLKY